MENNIMKVEITPEELKMIVTALKYYRLQQMHNNYIYGPGPGTRGPEMMLEKTMRLIKYLESMQ